VTHGTKDMNIHKLFAKLFHRPLDASFGEAVMLFLEVKLPAKKQKRCKS